MIRSQRKAGSKNSAETDPLSHQLECVILGSATGLIVLSTLVPSEDAVRGSGALLAGAWMVMLLVVQALVWKGTIKPQFAVVDWLVLALAAWIIISSWVMAWQGNPRQTLNSMWQWEAMFACYWTCRQLFTTAVRIGGLVAIMTSLVVGISAHGMYQFFVGIPHFVAEYQNADEDQRREILIQSGVDPDPHSPMVRNFEDRLRSREVYATFVLANSLAGVIAPWLIVLIAWQLHAPAGTRMQYRIALALASLIALGCLVLTKSRSAWIAFAVGLLGLAFIYRRSLLRQRLLLVSACLASVVVVAVGIWSRALDRQILTEAWLSLSYRFQYWQAAMQMTFAYPLFGCGPGNFQEYYALYKLPMASETVADPHNFLLEIAACAGIPATLLVIALLGAWLKSLASRDCADDDSAKIRSGETLSLLIGAAVGGLLAIPYGWIIDLPPESDPWFGLPVLLCLDIPVAAVVLAIQSRWNFVTAHRGLWRAPLAIAAIVLLVNLVAAGGISYLSVGLSFWVLAALALNDGPGARVILSRHFKSVAMAVSVVLLIASFVTSYGPVMQSKMSMDAATTRLAQAEDVGDLKNARRIALLAAKQDPWSAEPWRVLGQIDLQRGILGDADGLEDFENDVEQARLRNRHAQALEVSIGLQYLIAYQRAKMAKGLEKSLAAFERAAELYPNSNYIHAQLAWVAHLAGDSKRALEHANRAWELDAANPHWEQKLKQRQIEDFDSGHSTQLDQPSPDRDDAEQIVVWLRKFYDSGGADSTGTR